jgi:hypothetical protein
VSETAYKSARPEVIEAWQTYIAKAQEVQEKRAALSDQFGRRLMINRYGFGHGTRVVGFERFDSDQDGALLHNGLLRVPSSRSKTASTVAPNVARKAGKEFAAELASLSSPTLALPGMPSFHIGGGEDGLGLRSSSPALWEEAGSVYALWPCDDAPVDMTIWEKIPLSAYYLAKEQHDGSY